MTNTSPLTHLPALGLGTASLALAPEYDCSAALDYALANGIRYFDTAPLYGGGQAEVRLGAALKGADADIMVSTKCGRQRNFGAASPQITGISDRADYSAQGVCASVAQSCERLGRDYLDVVFLHDIEIDPDRALGEALPALRELQAKGRIGLVGAGCNTIAGLTAALNGGASDALLVAGRWTLLDRSAGAALLPLAAQKNTQIVAGALFNSGGLVAPDGPDATFDYRPMSDELRRKAHQLRDLAEAAGGTILAAALQFPARDHRVRTTLLGVANPKQLEASLKALAEPLPDTFWLAAQDERLHA